MTNEEFNRKMEFIVEQQAQFAADIQVMREVHDQDVVLLKETDRKLSNAIASAAEVVNGLAIAQARNEAKLADSGARLAEAAEVVNGLAIAQARNEAKLADSDARLAESNARLAESNARVDAKFAELSDRLNVFISVVERHISGNGNHGSPDHA